MPTTQASTETLTWQGQPALRWRDASGATALVAQHGAHLLSWCCPDGHERLYLSPTTRSGPGQSVRGGVPVIFPQFSQRGPDTSLPRHGFARTRLWQRAAALPASEGTAVSLVMRDDDATRALWPHRFELTLTLRLHGAQLELALTCVNTGESSFEFSAALHSYFAVEAIGQTQLEGLQGTRFLDTTCDREQAETQAVLSFDGGEIDRIHWQTGARPLTLRTPTRALRIESQGFDDAVVWNPGPQKAAALTDLARGDEARFVCVEAALIGAPPQLAPGERWCGVHRLIALV